ncbi:STE20-related kinase adapter protein beta [Echinops telfairi]|uniref:STE20-related kinase adapter protein beta n=1 Tax=Echinops telfairi TaxID=9371 RepID=A0AC55DLF1_ECHTE|nr:STE20-related kinase adapter protein beta [Echinops telfairi]
MSLLNCFCTSRTEIESLKPEKLSETSIHQYLVEEPALSWLPPCTGATEVINSTNASHYELQVEIGRGFDNLTFVYLARHTPTGTLVTIKLTNLENCTEERLKALQKSVALSHFQRHPNITTYWTVFTVGSWLWVISPFKAYGSASQLLRTYFPEGMSETLIRNILFGAVRGLNYLHQNGYLHRSIKASHILISGDGLVTLSGLSHLHSLVKHGQRHRAVYDFPQFSTSVQPWLSPELLRQDLHGYNVKSDIYSVGITACELASGQVPFQDIHRTQVNALVFFPRTVVTKYPNSGWLLRLEIAFRGLQLENKIYMYFFHFRPSASSLLSHVFFKQMKGQSQDSILSLLPPAYNKPSITVPPVFPGTEPEYTFPEEKDSNWEF